METIPWYKSAIIRQQVVQIILAVLAFVGVTTDIDWSTTVEAIFAGIAAVVAVWTIITRLIKPAPNMTVQAALKEQELIRSGDIPPQTLSNDTSRQRGFATPVQLLSVCMISLFALSLVGCVSTLTAYRTAKTLPDTAFVVAEHYAALVKQAADIAENPATPEDVKAALKAADRAVKPLILGDDVSNRPGLRDLADSYQQVRDAKTEVDLQNAIDDAVRELAHFINAVKAARSRTNVTSNFPAKPRPDRVASRCSWPGTAGAEQVGGRAVRVG